MFVFNLAVLAERILPLQLHILSEEVKEAGIARDAFAICERNGILVGMGKVLQR